VEDVVKVRASVTKAMMRISAPAGNLVDAWGFLPLAVSEIGQRLPQSGRRRAIVRA
jgi:hypothetical protein